LAVGDLRALERFLGGFAVSAGHEVVRVYSMYNSRRETANVVASVAKCKRLAKLKTTAVSLPFLLSACRSYLLIPKLADSTPTINDDDADNQHDITTSASEYLSKATKHVSFHNMYIRKLLEQLN
jgi:hypothetical protein